MRIRTNTRLIKSLHKQYWIKTRNVLKEMSSHIVARAEHTDPENLKNDVMNAEVMGEHLRSIWLNVGETAYNEVTRKVKSLGGNIETKADLMGKVKMSKYAYQRSLKFKNEITTSYQASINRVIDQAVDEAVTNNLPIEATRKLVKDYLTGEALASIENWQAERIARTEVGSAYQAGSWESLNENNEGVTKLWETSGWSNVRDTHAAFQDLGEQDMDFEYASGLQYPQDPNCNEAGLIINCNCVITYNTSGN